MDSTGASYRTALRVSPAPVPGPRRAISGGFFLIYIVVLSRGMDELELQHLTEIQTIEKMAMAMCSLEEIADALDVDTDTLKECLEKEPYSKIYRQARAQAKFKLRRSQIQLASENASMAKFLGTNILGQTDGRDEQNVNRHHHFHEHVHTLEERRVSLLEKFDELAGEEQPKQIQHNDDRVIEGDFSAKARSSGD